MNGATGVAGQQAIQVAKVLGARRVIATGREPDALQRLTAERALLAVQTSMLRSLTSAPAPDLRYSPYNPN